MVEETRRLAKGWKGGWTKKNPRHTAAPELIHRSDKGCRYTAVRFTERLVDPGICPVHRERRRQIR